ncbi:uncharacterized protein LOC126830061 isoform X2 [Patella vulgata]|uniref:uncharacterized protein LOC126830061 isoform X2 n=1 Tax=Patella vulgata TaxID=6465 RepID=UPI00217FF474|nr:uncharacterized protein LOC126830061 isoform X2 [Patella vulgata]
MENFKFKIIVFLTIIPDTCSLLTASPAIVFDGQELVLTCSGLTPYYNDQIVWRIGGQYIATTSSSGWKCKEPNYRYPRFTIRCSSHQLVINPVDYIKDKDKSWRCSVTNYYFNYTIQFGVPVRNILLSIEPESKTDAGLTFIKTRIGDNLSFKCEITPASQPLSFQMCDPTCLEVNLYGQTYMEKNVTINADMHRSVIYCTATYIEQIIRSRSTTILLSDDIQDLILTSSPRSDDFDHTLTLYEDEIMNLTCEALKAFPTPTIEIFIQSTNYNQSIVSTGRMLRSNVHVTHQMNGAIISCNADITTKQVEAKYKIRLQVLYAPIVSISVHNATNNNSTGININNSTGIILQCTADAQPNNLTFSPWQHYIGNELIREIPGMEEEDGKSYNLEVSTDFKDDGIYICSVSNGINRNNQTEQTARYLHNTVKAEFHSKNISKENGRVGDYIELYKIYTCPMDCNITWYKDERRDIISTIEYSRIPSYYNSTVLIPSNKTVIRLTSIQLSDTATYTCNICNTNGCIHSSVELIVETTSRLESIEGSDRQLVFGITGGAIFTIIILVIIIVVLVVILHRNKPVAKNPTKPEMEIMENALYRSADLDPTFTGNNRSNNNERGPVYAQVQKDSKENENDQKPEAVYYNTTSGEVLYSNIDDRL